MANNDFLKLLEDLQKGTIDYGQTATPVVPKYKQFDPGASITDALLASLPESPNIVSSKPYNAGAEFADLSGIGKEEIVEEPVNQFQIQKNPLKNLMTSAPKAEQVPIEPARGMADSLIARSSGVAPKITETIDAQPAAKIEPQISPETTKAAETKLTEVQKIIKSPSTTDDELTKAQSERDRLLALIAMGKGAQQIGASIAGVRPDETYLEGLKPLAESKVKDILVKREAEKDTVERELLKESSDPNSEYSRIYRDVARRYSPGLNISDNLSAAAISKLIPSLANEAAQREAREARLQQAQLLLTQKKQQAEEKDSDQKKLFTQSLRKEATAGKLGELYQAATKANETESMINEFLKKPSGYKDYGILMSALKSLQGDQSVVREAEITMGKNAASFFDKVQNYIDSAVKGTQLQPQQRKDILDAVQIMKRGTQRTYKEGLSGIISQAQEEKIDLGKIIPGNFKFDELEKGEGETVTIREKKSGQMKKFKANDPNVQKILANPDYEMVR